jgi:hypothetical protein
VTAPRRPHPNRRRHALTDEGRAPAILVRLSEDDRAQLAALSLAWGCPRAEVVRRLIRQARPG